MAFLSFFKSPPNLFSPLPRLLPKLSVERRNELSFQTSHPFPVLLKSLSLLQKPILSPVKYSAQEREDARTKDELLRKLKRSDELAREERGKDLKAWMEKKMKDKGFTAPLSINFGRTLFKSNQEIIKDVMRVIRKCEKECEKKQKELIVLDFTVKPPNKTIWVGGLSSSMDKEFLLKIFPEATSAKVIKDKKSGLSKCFGFVKFLTHEIAKEIIEGFKDGEIVVNEDVVNEDVKVKIKVAWAVQK